MTLETGLFGCVLGICSWSCGYPAQIPFTSQSIHPTLLWAVAAKGSQLPPSPDNCPRSMGAICPWNLGDVALSQGSLQPMTDWYCVQSLGFLPWGNNSLIPFILQSIPWVQVKGRCQLNLQLTDLSPAYPLLYFTSFFSFSCLFPVLFFWPLF